MATQAEGLLVAGIWTASKSDSLTLREKTTYFKNKQEPIVTQYNNGYS